MIPVPDLTNRANNPRETLYTTLEITLPHRNRRTDTLVKIVACFPAVPTPQTVVTSPLLTRFYMLVIEQVGLNAAFSFSDVNSVSALGAYDQFFREVTDFADST